MEEENIYVGVGWFRSWFFRSSLIHLRFAGFSEGEITYHPECKSRWKKCMCEQIALAFRGEKATDLTAAKVFLCCSIKWCFTQASVKKESQPSSNSCNGTKISAPLGLWTLMVTFLFHSVFQRSTFERKTMALQVLFNYIFHHLQKVWSMLKNLVMSNLKGLCHAKITEMWTGFLSNQRLMLWRYHKLIMG